MNEKESYIKQLRQLILEDDNLAYGESLEEAIYRIDNLVIYGGFYQGIRGYDHNELLLDNVTWKEIISWGTIIVPETKAYISNTPIIDLEELGYQMLPLDDNHIVGFK
ncbi:MULTISPECIES: hypothetical protein [unclassified Collinsella]|uniref:hypothetical protein n=1 Tax=unclassified Collinsella TaxID=2637548 RepID=UPI003F90A887